MQIRWNEDRLRKEAASIKAKLKSYSWDSRYEWIKNKKSEANSEYKRRNLKKALSEYVNCLLAIEYDSSSAHTDKINKTLRLDLLNNIAATEIELEHYEAAVALLNTSLSLYPNNLRMLIRRGKSHLRLSHCKQAQ